MFRGPEIPSSDRGLPTDLAIPQRAAYPGILRSQQPQTPRSMARWRDDRSFVGAFAEILEQRPIRPNARSTTRNTQSKAIAPAQTEQKGSVVHSELVARPRLSTSEKEAVGTTSSTKSKHSSPPLLQARQFLARALGQAKIASFERSGFAGCGLGSHTRAANDDDVCSPLLKEDEAGTALHLENRVLPQSPRLQEQRRGSRCRRLLPGLSCIRRATT